MPNYVIWEDIWEDIWDDIWEKEETATTAGTLSIQGTCNGSKILAPSSVHAQLQINALPIQECVYKLSSTLETCAVNQLTIACTPIRITSSVSNVAQIVAHANGVCVKRRTVAGTCAVSGTCHVCVIKTTVATAQAVILCTVITNSVRSRTIFAELAINAYALPYIPGVYAQGTAQIQASATAVVIKITESVVAQVVVDGTARVAKISTAALYGTCVIRATAFPTGMKSRGAYGALVVTGVGAGIRILNRTSFGTCALTGTGSTTVIKIINTYASCQIQTINPYGVRQHGALVHAVTHIQQLPCQPVRFRYVSEVVGGLQIICTKCRGQLSTEYDSEIFGTLQIFGVCAGYATISVWPIIKGTLTSNSQIDGTIAVSDVSGTYVRVNETGDVNDL